MRNYVTQVAIWAGNIQRMKSLNSHTNVKPLVNETLNNTIKEIKQKHDWGDMKNITS